MGGRAVGGVLVAAAVIGAAVAAGSAQRGAERRDGGIVRGPVGERRIALVFTGHEFAEGGPAILDALASRSVRASFFLTGGFLRTPDFAPLIARIVREGHYLGPHSDKHLLYCDWGPDKPTLVTPEAFARDLDDNLREIESAGVPRSAVRYWMPAYEWYNADIAAWSSRLGLTLVTFTPGTRSNADYTGEDDPNFVSSQRIVDSVLERERAGPDGLDGFILLLHIGAGPGRADKMHARVGELLDELARRRYRFVRVDDLLREGGDR
ncbi:MAG TPA: polysaccharide deacetylase family protein [Vicinamibacterales bacterium]|nr:polysaccharide deacetylase family protein [Vicinamibacterales bacterium]HPW20384.1 polysaccharide deacetylase family protein [Vicinamibacterales bacterium]